MPSIDRIDSSRLRSDLRRVHVSAPHNKTGMTQVLSMASLVVSFKLYSFQILRKLFMADEACPSRLRTSGSQRPELEILLPRYTKSSTTSTDCPFTT